MKPLSEESMLLIHKYFKDELSETALVEFNSAMKDESFRKELDFQSTVMEGVIQHRRDSLKDLLNNARLDMNNNDIKDVGHKSINQGFKISRKVIVFASLLILGFIGYFMYNGLFTSTVNTDMIFAENYNPYFNENTERSTTTLNIDPVYDEAIELYKVKNDYNAALAKFKLILPQTNKIKLYRANCLIGLNKFLEAKNTLSNINEPKNSKLHQQIDWYNLLLDIKLKNIDEAMESSNYILSDKDHLYNRDVLKLIGLLAK